MAEILTGIAFNYLGEYCHLNVAFQSMNIECFPFRSSNSFYDVLYFSVYKLYSSFIKCISKYCILLEATVNVIDL